MVSREQQLSPIGRPLGSGRATAKSTIRTQRAEIRQLLDDSPNLRRELPDFLGERYEMARRNAAAETGLPLATFPTESPFALDQILAEEWLP